MKTKIFWTLISIILGGMRLYGIKSEFFQAIAHLVVGGFFGAYIGDKINKRFYFWLGISLSLLELTAFLMGIGK